MTRSPSPDPASGAAPGAGDRFPDLRLADHNGNERELSELVAGDPTALVFWRGPWCPKERAFFRRLVGFQTELEVAYARVVSVSVDSVEVQAAFRAGLDARWTFLADPERRYLDALGLREVADTLHDPYLPAVFTLAPDLSVHRAYNGYWFWGRPTVEELRQDFRALSREHRPDWDPPSA
ncbi:MAG: redoxin domain-containing protein [Miltoncostaeaceae bacterium]